MAEEQNSQVVEKPAAAAPAVPDIDVLLPTIPELKELFGEPPAKEGHPEQKKPTEAPVTEPGAQELASEVEIPEGLKPEEEKPPEEPKSEELSESVQKRIDKLTAQRKTAEEKAKSLETELAELKSKYQAPPPIQPTRADPLADIESDKDLDAKIEHIQSAKDWCLRHLNGGNISDGNGGEKWLEAGEVADTLANADRMLTQDVPKRRVFLAERTRHDAVAKREYPALFKEGTEPYKTMHEWFKVFPECRKFSDIKLIIGDALVGQQIRVNREKARSSNGNAPSRLQAQPLAPPAPAASPRVPQNKALSGKELQEAFANDPRAALDSFVDSLIDGGRSGAAKR